MIVPKQQKTFDGTHEIRSSMCIVTKAESLIFRAYL